jgi:hypothetical protein
MENLPPQEGIGDHPDPVELDQDSRMTEPPKPVRQTGSLKRPRRAIAHRRFSFQS